MNDSQYYEGNPQYQIVQYDGPVEEQESSALNVLFTICRRWRMALVISLITSAIIVPIILLAGKANFETEGAIRVTPVVSRILFRDPEADRPMPNYENFVNTQASLMTSNNVLNRVADELSDKDLEFFKGVDDYAVALKLAINKSKITIAPVTRTEIVKVSMKTPYARQAELIINTFIRAYMAMIASDELKGGDQKLAILEERRRVTSEQINRQREEIRRLAEEYGTVALTGRQDMMLQQVMSLQNELTANEVKKISLDASVKMKESGTSEFLRPGEMMRFRNEFVNSDLAIQALSTDVAEQEAVVLQLKQVMAPENLRYAREVDVFESLKTALELRTQEVQEKFNEEFEAAVAKNQNYRLADLKSQFEKALEYERRLRERLDKANSETIKMGRKQLTIDNLQEKLTRQKETYDVISRRISELEMERQRQARVSVAYMASSVPAQSKKVRYTVVFILLSLCFGCVWVLVLEKTDTSVRGTDDIVKRVGVRVIGTTTSPSNIDRLMLGQRLSDDYQTIRANLGLLDKEMKTKIIAVSSAGVGDGKTTFSVNLATSFAQSGEKVLLIDGDLRKPDIAVTLNLPKYLRGLQDLLEGGDPQKAVFVMPSTGLHVLASDRTNTSDALDLLGQDDTAKKIRSLCEKYDHVIINTPPVLAFTDALLWAKMADGVILTTFVERTSSIELKETIERLGQVEATIIGTVVNNVQIKHSYHRYGYGYGYNCDEDQEQYSRGKEGMLLLANETETDADKKSR